MPRAKVKELKSLEVYIGIFLQIYIFSITSESGEAGPVVNQSPHLIIQIKSSQWKWWFFSQGAESQ